MTTRPPITPGIWKAYPSNRHDGAWIIEGNGCLVAEVDALGENRPHNAANARCIAQVPAVRQQAVYVCRRCMQSEQYHKDPDFREDVDKLYDLVRD